jgi:hypothetical protein
MAGNKNLFKRKLSVEEAGENYIMIQKRSWIFSQRLASPSN